MTRTEHSLWLDWLRFLAAFEVLLTHVRGYSIVDYSSLPPSDHNLLVAALFGLSRMGHEAVIVFFVLSGFLVGGRVASRSLSGRFDLGQYAVDRVGRIMTPLLPAIVLAALVEATLTPPADLMRTVGNLLSLQGIAVVTMPMDAPLWSLAFEVWFYVLGGVVGLMICQKRATGLTFAVAIVASMALIKLDISYLAYWAFGAAVYLWRPRNPRSMIFVGLLILVSGVGIYQLCEPSNSAPALATANLSWPLNAKFGEILVAIGTAVLLPPLAGLRALAGARWFSFGSGLAAFSYSLYLTHYPILNLLRGWLGVSPAISFSAVCLTIGEVAACLGVAIASYWAFESRAPAVKKWLRTRAVPEGPTRLGRDRTEGLPGPR